MKNREMSNYKHVLKERDYKGSMDDERNRRRDKERDSNSKHSSDGNSKHSSDGNSKHSHKSRRSNSPHRSSHHKKSPLKSKIEYSNSDHHRNRKRRETELNESYEELSRRKRKLESELRALDLEEAAQREAENKKARKEKSDKREVPEARNKSSSRSDVNDKKTSKSKTLNVTVKVEKDKDKDQGHASRSSENDNNWGRPQEESKDLNKEKPNFEVSGKLAEETNTYNGVVIKYNEPSEARKPKRKWRLYPFKGDSDLPYIPIHRQSAYLFGRTRSIADIPIDHPSCSKQHAVLQYRLVPYKREDGTTGRRVRPYIIDLESSNGTFVNNNKIKPRCYVELVEKDVVKFGYSSREYVLLHEESKNDDEDDDVLETND